MRIRQAAAILGLAGAILGTAMGTASAGVTYNGSIYPYGNTDKYKVKLTIRGTVVYVFALDNFTKGFNAGFTILVNGRKFVVNSRGPGGGELFRLTVNGTTTATVIVGAIGGASVGNYRLRITP